MLVYTEWLNEYVEVKEDIDTFCEKMIMSGSNIETVEHFGNGIEKVVVGKLLSVEKHPDADKLLVCLAEVGEEEPIQIVTGAQNVFVGAYVPVILHGGKLPDGTVIKKGKLRGVESCGMFCSPKELGFEDKVICAAYRDGIWILDKEYTPGLDIVEAMGLAGDVVDFEITPNRPDCLSMVGMAREAAATFGGAMNYPDSTCVKEEGAMTGLLQVEIKKPELCKRYVARIVKDVKIAPSPWWMQKRLMYAGMRPINNIVDITNYVMLEYGQPIHAFDIRNIKGSKIVVDTAFEGELFTTLDGTERTLEEGMLLIKDAERAVAIAGVMGGLNSEIEPDTQTIVIESANFFADSVRLTSKKLALRTEASSRFEKGVDPNLAETAANRVCRLIELLSAGTVITGALDEYPTKADPITIDVRTARINQVLGTALTTDAAADIFRRLEMETKVNGEVISVIAPTVRRDLLKEIDMIEEVARIYGYDQLPTTLHKGSNRADKTPIQILRSVAKEALTGMGTSEIQTYSFVSPKGLDKILTKEEDRLRSVVRLINPLGEENSIMRTTLIPNMLEVLERNYSRGISAVRAFELGNTFFNEVGEDGLPSEREALCVAAYGGSETFFTLKGLVEELLKKLGIEERNYIPEASIATFHPGRTARILSGGEALGIIGEIHPDVMDQYHIDTKVYCCELDFAKIAAIANRVRYYSPLPKYPATSRDIALVVQDEVLVKDIEAIIKASGTELLEDVALFDVYRGKQIAEGQKSVAFSLTYRAKDRTLTDDEVIKVHSKVLSALNDSLGATLREM
ncbi:MAG: phenylalanine--tRNA ligase subunit beta [Eubacteriales bacterium]|nr:phenylalanine--tRNA ligase subunit beta [Eubacteriales bacterium]MDD3349443.1 phenylalanine--tRNA ligase subunit beta [Eubacteriales bacterium]